MSTNPADLLQSKFINSWNLFWLITLPISTVMVYSMMGVPAQEWDLLAVNIRLDRLLVAHVLLQQSHCSRLYLLLGGFPGLGLADGSMD